MTSISTVRIGALVAAAATLAALVTLAVHTADSGDDSGYVAIPFFALALAALGTWLFRGAVPRAIAAGPETAARRAAMAGGASLLSVPLFWTALPFLVAPVAMALGIEARRRGGGAGALAGVVLGAVALVAASVMVLVGLD